jgi:hypothetical protein
MLASIATRALPLLLAVLMTVACSRDTGTQPTTTPARSATSVPTTTRTTAPATATATAPLPRVAQRVIDAVAVRDGPTLTSMAEYQHVPCTTRQGLGVPPKCKPGDSEGTTYTVFATGSCEGTWTDDASLPLSGISSLAGPVYAVAAVTPPQPDPEPEWPKGSYIVLFNRTAPDKPGPYFILSDTGIVRAHVTCGGAGSERDLIRALGGTRYLLGRPS